eukprot:CAMPEP_0167756698 /NCGR_PEP_ID=MMETSP0110_2-20121227/9528_1 /TAXON_ID=629695 /ORGANISM="Gymnochlora sp., Strain CCMP2014" /LENGTH=306 /DNA_ID=CAMNT_0007642833 /DNA_START=182 /DNA_END=1099 /DNA_ORIENTATION=-
MEGLYFYPDRKDEDYGKSNVENLEVHTLFQSEKEALSISDSFCIYTIDCRLPINIPPSFEGEIFKFRYRMILKLNQEKGPPVTTKYNVTILPSLGKIDADKKSEYKATKMNLKLLNSQSHRSTEIPCWVSEENKKLCPQSDAEVKQTDESPGFVLNISQRNTEAVDELFLSTTAEFPTYNLDHGNERIIRLILSRKHLYPGDTIYGKLSTNDCQSIVVLRVNVDLLSKESLGRNDCTNIRGNFNAVTENCLHCVFALTIPKCGPFSFITSLGSLEWSLNFKFVIRNVVSSKVSMLKWELPLKVSAR